MKRTSWLKYLVLVTVLVMVVILDIMIGSVRIPTSEILATITGGQAANPGWETIILEFRIPKAITALLAGSGLAVSGLIMQTMFRNPLAGPFVLGISSGASLGVALLVLAGSIIGTTIFQFSLAGGWTLVLAAITGATAVLMLVLAISLKVHDTMTLLIIGLMVGSLSAALVSVLQFYSQAQEIQTFLIWTFGNLGGVHGQELRVLFGVVMVGILVSWVLCKSLNALLLGESYAFSLGVNIKRTRLLIIVATSILAGGITAFCGPLAFVGIAVPHLARMLFKTADHRTLIPGCLLLGAIVMTLCDLVSQVPGSSQTLPINAITSLVGAPAVIAILIKSRRLSNSFS
jgi:iron complex transport system permease protein